MPAQPVVQMLAESTPVSTHSPSRPLDTGPTAAACPQPRDSPQLAPQGLTARQWGSDLADSSPLGRRRQNCPSRPRGVTLHGGGHLRGRPHSLMRGGSVEGRVCGEQAVPETSISSHLARPHCAPSIVWNPHPAPSPPTNIPHLLQLGHSSLQPPGLPRQPSWLAHAAGSRPKPLLAVLACVLAAALLLQPPANG